MRPSAGAGRPCVALPSHYTHQSRDRLTPCPGPPRTCVAPPVSLTPPPVCPPVLHRMVRRFPLFSTLSVALRSPLRALSRLPKTCMWPPSIVFNWSDPLNTWRACTRARRRARHRPTKQLAQFEPLQVYHILHFAIQQRGARPALLMLCMFPARMFDCRVSRHSHPHPVSSTLCLLCLDPAPK